MNANEKPHIETSKLNPLTHHTSRCHMESSAVNMSAEVWTKSSKSCSASQNPPPRTPSPDPDVSDRGLSAAAVSRGAGSEPAPDGDGHSPIPFYDGRRTGVRLSKC